MSATAHHATRGGTRLEYGPVIAQIKAELAMTLRRGESVLLTIGIPVALLAFFAGIGYPPHPGGTDTIGFLTPGILALAVMSTAMVSLGIATGFERQYGVLKRLGTTPLGRPGLLVAKTVAIAGVELVQVVILVPVALALGWHPYGDVVIVILAIALATVGFAGIGLFMAGRLTAEMTLASANGLYIIQALFGGMVFPLSVLPHVLRDVARLLPAAALSDALRHTLGTGSAVPGRAWLVLVFWAVAAPAAAGATFRWE